MDVGFGTVEAFFSADFVVGFDFDAAGFSLIIKRRDAFAGVSKEVCGIEEGSSILLFPVGGNIVVLEIGERPPVVRLDISVED